MTARPRFFISTITDRETVAKVHFAATFGMAAVIWFVQLVTYPQFALVGEETFAAYHKAYANRVAWIVGPLMLAELATGLLLLRHAFPCRRAVPLACISHTTSSRDAARTCPRKARTGFPAGLYENILSKGKPVRNEAGARRSQSQQNGYEKCGLALAGLLLVGVLWAVTGLVQVPLHGRLASGYDAEAASALVAGNWIRTLLWTFRVPLAWRLLAPPP